MFGSKPTAPEMPAGKATTKSGEQVELKLYKFDSCPFCRRVLDFLREHPIPLEYRDTRQDEGARDDLIQIGGINQVPCLVIDGKPMYESADIIEYLKKEFV